MRNLLVIPPSLPAHYYAQLRNGPSILCNSITRIGLVIPD